MHDFGSRAREVSWFINDASFGNKNKKSEWGVKMMYNILEQEQIEGSLQKLLDSEVGLYREMVVLEDFFQVLEFVLNDQDGDHERKKKILIFARELAKKIVDKYTRQMTTRKGDVSTDCFISESEQIISQIDAYLAQL